MPLMKLSELLNHAEENQYALGYFEAWDTYSFEAVLEAAEEENSPVVLGFGGTMMNQQWFAQYGIEPLGAYGRCAACKSKVPVAFILNEVLELNHIAKGLKAGYNTVMLDSCHLPFEQNAAITRKVVEMARPKNIEVQAEFGRLPNFGESAAGTLTDPERAAEFVDETGVDFLAVSIGNVHLQTKGTTTVDLERLKKIREKVEVPLVIHGGSGFPKEIVKEVIAIGVSLFHFGTLMKKTFLEQAISTAQKYSKLAKLDYQAMTGSRKNTDMLIPAKQAVKKSVKEYMQLYGSAGKVF